jgi:hypothetical protein
MNLEEEFRQEVRISLRELVKQVGDLKIENATQHGELSKRIEVIFTELRLKIDQINEDLKEKITAKNKLMWGLVFLIMTLSGIVAEAKFHISTLFKFLGFDKG